MNQVNFSGFLGTAPALKELPSGDSVMEFSLAVRAGGKDRILWVRCHDFSQRRAEKLYSHFSKGSGIEVSGYLREVRTYTSAAGEARASLEMVVSTVDFPPVRRDERGAAKDADVVGADDGDGNIPF